MTTESPDNELVIEARAMVVPNVDDVVATYLKFRRMKEQVEADAKTKVDALKLKMLKLETWIKEQADLQGVTSFKTKHGTAFLTTTDFANVADWDALLEFIRQGEHFDMLEKRVAKLAVRGYIDQHKTVPPGVNYGTKLEVNVRKPAPGAVE